VAVPTPVPVPVGAGTVAMSLGNGSGNGHNGAKGARSEPAWLQRLKAGRFTDDD
jgi:hypothetical protein